MKISKISEYHIIFDNNSLIDFSHERDCCEWTYAQFEYLKEEAGIYEFDFPEPPVFEACDYGFRFGSETQKFFVPCYSEQNGYYSSDVDIYYNNKLVLYHIEGSLILK
jgi:hypothetical protein